MSEALKADAAQWKLRLAQIDVLPSLTLQNIMQPVAVTQEQLQKQPLSKVARTMNAL